MNIFKRLWPGLLALCALALALDVAERAGVSGVTGFVAPAAAVVGRPLTPVSYAGVARRTARRCVGMYYC
jgi:integral membrane sensor domain MASE1